MFDANRYGNLRFGTAETETYKLTCIPTEDKGSKSGFTVKGTYGW